MSDWAGRLSDEERPTLYELLARELGEAELQGTGARLDDYRYEDPVHERRPPSPAQSLSTVRRRWAPLSSGLRNGPAHNLPLAKLPSKMSQNANRATYNVRREIDVG
jgi:hypothetical protein